MANILIVDDDPAIRDLTARHLVKHTHEVLEAESADEAFSIIDDHTVDLVILDIVMPGRGGIETIMEMHGSHPDLPVVIMSGKIPLGTVAVDGLMQRYGARAVLPKPFTGEELLTAVQTALGESS